MSTRTLRIRAVFRPEDEDAAIVLRVVAAANDLGILFRMMLAYTKDGDGQSAYRRSLSDSARRYACRMGTIQLPDVWKLVNSGDFIRVEARLSRRIPDLTAAAARFRSAVNRDPLRMLVAGVRNNVAGHPNRLAFERALALVQDGGLMDVPTGYTGGNGDHFNVTDRLFDALLVEDSHAKYSMASVEESVTVLLNEMIDAQLALRDLAAVLVAAMYRDNMNL